MKAKKKVRARPKRKGNVPWLAVRKRMRKPSFRNTK